MQLTVTQTGIIVLAAVAATAIVTHQLARKHPPPDSSVVQKPSAVIERELREHLVAAAKQQEIVAQLKSNGYHVTYDYLSTPSSDPAPAVARLVDRFGADFVGRPFYIGNSGVVTMVDLLPLLPSLQNVDFDKSDVSDDQLAVLKDLPNLRVLFLNETSIGSKGIAHLVGTTVEVLHLQSCNHIDDACVPYLARMKSLKKLYLDKRNLSAAALVRLERALPDCDID